MSNAYDELSVRWTPAEVLSMHEAAARDLEADPSAPHVPVIERDCAMANCNGVAEGPPLVVSVATLPGPFAIDLCDPCREPFENAMEAVGRLLGGDVEARPHRFDGRHAAESEAER